MKTTEHQLMEKAMVTAFHCRDCKMAIKLLKEFPKYAQIEDATHGRLPIHKAVLKQSPLELIQALLDVYPAGASISDKKGFLPIHYAASQQVNTEIVDKLCDIFPEGLRSSGGSGGMLPLHMAAKHMASAEIILDLLKRYPDAIRKRSRQGCLPIHFAAQNKPNVEVMRILIEADRASLRELYAGKNPLQQACACNADLSVIAALVEADFETIKERSIDGMMALHYAAASKASKEVVDYLIRKYSQATSVKDRNGRFPLHHALENQANGDTILAIMAVDVSIVEARGHGGNYPLHIALDKQCAAEVTLALLDIFPGAASQPDMFGFMPLRRAIVNGAEDRVILALLQTFPQGAAKSDEYNRTPLHYAITKKLSSTVVSSILEMFPEGARIPDKNGQLAIHIAVKRLCEPHVLRLLLESFPDCISQKDEYGLTPLHHAIEVENSIEQVEALLVFDPFCATICYENRIPLHLAIELSRFELIEPILRAYPDGSSNTASDRGRIPLTAAICERAPIEALMLLAEAYSDGCATYVDEDGMKSIHYAVKYHEPVQLVRYLLELNPECVFEKNLPIYFNPPDSFASSRKKIIPMSESKKFALSSGNRWESNGLKVPDLERTTSHPEVDEIDLFREEGELLATRATKQASQSIRAPRKEEKSTQNGRLLLHFAVELMRAPADSVAEILFRTMPIYPVDLDEDGEPQVNPRHSYTWTYLLANTEDRYFESVELVLQRYDRKDSTDLILLLAESPDELGKKAVDIATLFCQRALLRRLYFFVRYQLKVGPHLHDSSDSLIQAAWDHEDEKKVVAMKFMKSRVFFDKEANCRSNYPLDDNFILPILRTHDGDIDPSYREETIKKGLGEYPYCVVLPSADRTLADAILHENFHGGKNWRQIRQICLQITKALSHLHGQGLIHGNLKPLTVLRHNGRMKLIDLTHCASYFLNEVIGGSRCSSAYSPPEMFTAFSSQSALGRTISTKSGDNRSAASSPVNGLHQEEEEGENETRDFGGPEPFLDEPIEGTASLIETQAVYSTSRKLRFQETIDTGADSSTGAFVRPKACFCSKTGLAFEETEHAQSFPVELTPAHPSIDMWSLGAILYYMSTGEPLFLPSVEDRIDAMQLTMLADWSDSLKKQRVSRVFEPLAANLITQLLSKDPRRRPDTERVLRHPFLTGKPPARFPGMPAEFDICIISRTALENNGDLSPPEQRDVLLETELVHKRWLRRLLRARGLKVCECDEKCENLIKSRAAVIVLSRFAVNYRSNSWDSSSKETCLDKDSFLVKLRLCLELPALGLLEGGLCSLLIGDRSDVNPLTHVEDRQERSDILEAINRDVVVDADNDRRNDLPHSSYFEYGLTEGDDELNESTGICTLSPLFRSHTLFARVEDTLYGTYFENFGGEVLGRYGGCHPKEISKAVNEAVETAVQTILDDESLATGGLEELCPSLVMKRILSSQSFQIAGSAITAWRNAANGILYWLAGSPDNNSPSSKHSRTLLSRYSQSLSSPKRSPSATQSRMSPVASGIMGETSQEELDLSRGDAMQGGSDEGEDKHFTVLAFSDSNAMTTATLGLLENKLVVKDIEIESLHREIAELKEQLNSRLDVITDLRLKLNM